MRLVSVLAVLGILGSLLGGCGDDRPPAVVQDAGPRDASRSDGGGTGDDMDASVLDGSTPEDAEVPPDAEKMDAGPAEPDAGPEEIDGGNCTDLCPCPAPADACASDAACGEGERCIEDVCGTLRCVPAGAPCGGSGDCPSGSACVAGVCLRPVAGCVDSRECPAGFECEAGECVDRRVPCVEPDDCPRGYACRLPETTLGGGFCARVHRPCASDAGCTDFVGGRCADVDLDGDTECTIPSVACTTNADCDPESVCTVFPVSRVTECARFGGLCRTAADCTSEEPSACVDVSGQGQPECARPVGGTCNTSSDCPPRQVCATFDRESPPRCIAGSAM